MSDKSEKPTLFEKLFPYLMVVILTPVMFAMGLGLGYLMWGQEQASVPLQATQPPSTTDPQATEETAQADGQDGETQEVTRYDVPIDDDPSIGPEDAPIVIIEFSDFECPYCKRWHDETFEQLMENYPDEILFVYRDFPLSFHPNAVSAAEAANCAGEQDAYWEYHAALFSYELAFGESTYLTYAEELNLDIDAFTECMEENRYYDEVIDDFEYAAGLGVTGTPTFFINGIPIVGAQPYQVFKQIIDEELASIVP
jgi:protein-disulfide isomerase